MRQRILEASVSLLARAGLGGWTVEEVSKEASCAKGLVIYHHASKRDLLMETARFLVDSHQDARRLQVSEPDGIGALESLWRSLVNEVESGRFSAWLAIHSDPELRPAKTSTEQTVNTETVLARSLEVDPEVFGPPGTLSAALDGVQLRLAGGWEPAQVRPIFDQLWLGLLAG